MAKLPWRSSDDEPAEFPVPDRNIDTPGDGRFGGSVAAIGMQDADCCAGRPSYRAVIPSSAERPHPTDLLLCSHHYRAGRDGLVRAGAAVYDAAGRLVASGPAAELVDAPVV